MTSATIKWNERKKKCVCERGRKREKLFDSEEAQRFFE
jgi:hypothetical protein